MSMMNPNYIEPLDTNCDGRVDAEVIHADWDGDGVAHPVGIVADTNYNGVMDTVVKLNPGDGSVESVSYDFDENGTIDLKVGSGRRVEMADFDDDGCSTYQEVSLAQRAVDALADL